MLAERIERIALIEPLTQSGYLEPAGRSAGTFTLITVRGGAGWSSMARAMATP